MLIHNNIYIYILPAYYRHSKKFPFEQNVKNWTSKYKTIYFTYLLAFYTIINKYVQSRTNCKYNCNETLNVMCQSICHSMLSLRFACRFFPPHNFFKNCIILIVFALFILSLNLTDISISKNGGNQVILFFFIANLQQCHCVHLTWVFSQCHFSLYLEMANYRIRICREMSIVRTMKLEDQNDSDK